MRDKCSRLLSRIISRLMKSKLLGNYLYLTGRSYPFNNPSLSCFLLQLYCRIKDLSRQPHFN